jgi:hypothetical protein
MTGHWSSLHQQGALSVGCVSHHQGFHGVRIEGGSHKIELSRCEASLPQHHCYGEV